MFEITLFNTAQIFDQLFAFVAYIFDKSECKSSFLWFRNWYHWVYPRDYLLVVTELWWLVACIPIWVFINYKGIINNWREFKVKEN